MSEEIRLYYYTSQTAAANAMKNYIDNYLNNQLPDDELKKTIKEIVRINQDIFVRNEKNEFALKIRQHLGKKRLKIINRVLEEET